MPTAYSGLTAAPRALTTVFPAGSLLELAGNRQDVVAIDFKTGMMLIRDSVTPANDFFGPIEDKLTITGGLAPTSKGAYFDATHYATLATSAFRYVATEMSVYAKWRPDFNGHPASQANILFIDNSGNDRFAFYYPAANPPRFVFGDGAAVQTMVSPVSPTVIDTPYEAWFGAGPLGGGVSSGLLFVGSTVATVKPTTNLAASTPAVIILGGGGGGSSPLNGWIESLVIVPKWYPVTWQYDSGVLQRVSIDGRPFPDDRKDRIVTCSGDSYSNNINLARTDFYVEKLAARFGSIYRPANCAASGGTSANMMSRRATMSEPGVPYIAIVYGTPNDADKASTVQAAPVPTDTVFKVAAGFGAGYYRDGWILVGAESAQIASMSGDQITLTAPLAGGAPAVGTAVALDTQKNIQKVGEYLQGLGTSRIIVAGMHFLNFATGGDTTSVERSDLALLRDKQEAAATALGVPFVNLYEWMKQLILDGEYAAGDDTAWHYAVGDAHPNAVGETIFADAFEATIRAQGWV